MGEYHALQVTARLRVAVWHVSRDAMSNGYERNLFGMVAVLDGSFTTIAVSGYGTDALSIPGPANLDNALAHALSFLGHYADEHSGAEVYVEALAPYADDLAAAEALLFTGLGWY